MESQKRIQIISYDFQPHPLVIGVPTQFNVDYRKISILLNGEGNLADKYGQRITSHPGPFNVLVSPNEKVVQNTITDLSIHGEIFDLMGLSRTPYNKINIHCNGVYGDKQSAMDRFCKNFEKLPESVQTRLTVENDDKAVCIQ